MFATVALHRVSRELARIAAFEPGDSPATNRSKLNRLLGQLDVALPDARAVIADLLGVGSDLTLRR